jgi:23S rRNA (guanosine2251-2'-O)-methyltransferase
MRLENKVAIITGGSRGIGFATADKFLKEGATVILTASSQASAETAVEKLKELGLWIFTAEAGGTPYYETDWDCGVAVVLGSEGEGVSRLVREKSDFIVSIPMYGKVNSLNVSTASSVILCHAARMQRSPKP